MGGLAEELRLDLDDAKARPPHPRAAPAVHHHRGVHLAEDARLQELDLPGAALLGGRADDLHPPRHGQRAERADERGAGARARGGDHVVAARVPDPRQRVVLAQDRDGRARRRPRDRGAEGRGQAAHAPLDARAVLIEEVGEPRVGLLLLETQFRVVVNAMGQRLELVGEAVGRLHDARLQRTDGHRAPANSCFARVTSAGSVSRSTVVMAMSLAAISMPSRASGLTAAASKAREWIGVPSGAIFISGWIVGTTWLTLPTSEEPRRSFTSGDSETPRRPRFPRHAPSSASLRFIGS